MVKRQKAVSLIYLIVGVVIILIFAFTNVEDYNSGFLGGIGGSLTFVGLFRLVRLQRLSRNPEKAADYEAANQDERVQYIAGKARAFVFSVSIYIQGTAALLAQFVFNQNVISTVLCSLVCTECLLLVLVYWYYSRKY